MSVELNQAMTSEQGVINQDGDVSNDDNKKDVKQETPKLPINDEGFNNLVQQYNSGAIDRAYFDGYSLTKDQSEFLDKIA